MAIKSTDRRRASANNNLIGNYRLSGDEQTMLVRDIISEGPIEGLVSGGASIYVNDDPLMHSTETPVASLGAMKVSGTAGTTTLTVSNNNSYYGIASLKPKFIMIKNILVVNGNITQEGIESRYLGTVLKIRYKYKFTISGPGNFTTQMAQGSSVDQTEGSPSATMSKNLIGVAEFPGGLTFPMANVTATSFDFTSTRADLHEHSLFSLLRVSQYYDVVSIANNTVNLVSPLQYDVTNRDFSVPGSPLVKQGTEIVDKKYLNSSFQFSPGTLTQAPHKSFFGNGTSSFQLSGPDIGTELTAAAPQTVQGLSNGVSSAQVASMDKAIITFQYPSGLYRVNKDQGNEYPEFVAYRIELAVQRTSDVSELNNYVKLPGNYRYTASEPSTQTYRNGPIATGEILTVHIAKTKDAYIVSEVIDLEPYKPFIDFRIKITRVTKDGQDSNSETKDYRNLDWKEHPNSTSIHSAKISDVTALVTEQLNYPFTSLATVTFSSKNFASMPTRSYECLGLRVKVPSIYITREENDGLNAKYTRSPTTGADTGLIQFWDGSFRSEKVYTDNPAWVFYDILTNNRYGLGDWMKKEGGIYTDIDVYSLFKIAKYCDQLVPDGKGGLEPRMRANFYFTKATDCYKVLKDMATTFHSILYWADGKLMPVMDAPREAVYTFTKGNVIDGMFSYESTGSKTRANQIIVSWTNPENNYKLEPLIVEDRDNIIKTGRILKEDANAFGATSYGQALRFGRWKLWTAINQTEIVSFATSINAAFLAPGDVINIQDAHEHSIQFSGRATSGTTTQLTLDRQIPITPDASNTYELSVLYTGTFGVVNQVNALIGGTGYYQGEIVPSITTKEQAENAVDDFGDYVDIILSNTTYVATTMVDSASVNGEGKTVLTFTSFPLTATPSNGTVWAIKHIQDGSEVASSYKKYKIISISQEEKSKYSIVAVEYFDEKYEAVEKDFTLELEDPLFPTESNYVDVPNVEDLRISRRARRASEGEDIVVSWTAPGSIYTTTNAAIYEHLRGYEIEYYDQDERYVVELSPSATSYTLNLETVETTVAVGVTVISTNGRRSRPVIKLFNLEEAAQGSSTRFYGIRVGAVSDTNLSLNGTDGTASFTQQPTLAPASVNVDAKTMLNNTSQECSILADGESAYLFVDYSIIDTADSLKLVQYLDDETLRVSYWYDLNATNRWVAGTGSVSIAAGSSKVIGTGTSFTTQFGQDKQKVLKLSATEAALVTIVESDTVMYIDRIFTTDVTSSSFEVAELDIDFKVDFLIAKIHRASATSYSKQSYLILDTTIVSGTVTSVLPIYAADSSGSTPRSATSGDYVYFYKYTGEEPTDLDAIDLTGITFTRVKAEAGLNVSILSSDGSVFKNNTGADKTLSVKVFDAEDGSELTPTSYKWTYADGTDVLVTSASVREVVATGGVVAEGAAFTTIIVGAEDVPDDGVKAFNCEVTV